MVLKSLDGINNPKFIRYRLEIIKGLSGLSKLHVFCDNMVESTK